VNIQPLSSHGSVATQLMRGSRPCDELHREFPQESISKRILKTGLYLPQL